MLLNGYEINSFSDFALSKMSFTITFDRNIKGCVFSPGGYELSVIDNPSETIAFDFLDYEGYVREDDPKKLDVIVKNYDHDSFPDTVNYYFLIQSKFSEFYLDTGDAADPEINPVKIEDIAFELRDLNGNKMSIDATEDHIKSVNDLIHPDEDTGEISKDISVFNGNKKYTIIITSENLSYSALMDFVDHPEMGLLTDIGFFDTKEELYKQFGRYEGLFYQLYDNKVGRRISCGVFDPDWPWNTLKEINKEENLYV